MSGVSASYKQEAVFHVHSNDPNKIYGLYHSVYRYDPSKRWSNWKVMGCFDVIFVHRGRQRLDEVCGRQIRNIVGTYQS